MTRLSTASGILAATLGTAGIISTEHVNPFVVLILGTALAITGFWATHKSKLASTIAGQRDKLIELLTGERDAWKDRCERDEIERKESEARHEAVIAEYRGIAQVLRDKLQLCTEAAGEAKATIADLQARTDFKPIHEFQKMWYGETKVLAQQILEAMKHSANGWTALAPVLAEVSAVLREFGHKTQDVRMVNTAADPAKVEDVGNKP